MNEQLNHAQNLRNGVMEDDRCWVVTLNKHEIQIVEAVTRDKLGIEDVRQIQNRVADYHKRLDAFGAELAFCKLFNVYRDFDMQYLGYDLVIS